MEKKTNKNSLILNLLVLINKIKNDFFDTIPKKYFI